MTSSVFSRLLDPSLPHFTTFLHMLIFFLYLWPPSLLKIAEAIYAWPLFLISPLNGFASRKFVSTNITKVNVNKRQFSAKWHWCPLLTALHCNQDSRLSITLELPQLFEKDQLLPATEFQSSDSIEKSI